MNLGSRTLTFTQAVEVLKNNGKVYVKAPFEEGCILCEPTHSRYLTYTYLNMAESRHWYMYEVLEEDNNANIEP